MNLENTGQKELNFLEYYCEEIKKIPFLTKQEEQDLVIKMQNGDEDARQKLIEHNLRFVVSVAKEYVGQGLDFEDLIQLGNEGLIAAIDKFDLSKKIRLCTFAKYLIIKKIKRGIHDLGPNASMPMPEEDVIENEPYSHEMLNLALKQLSSRRELLIRLYCGIQDEENYNPLFAYPHTAKECVPIIKINSKKRVQAFENKIEKELESIFWDVAPEYKEEVNTLTSQEQFIIRMYLGIQNPQNYNPLFNKEHSCIAIAEEIGMSVDEVYKITRDVFEKLGNPCISKIADILNNHKGVARVRNKSYNE